MPIDLTKDYKNRLRNVSGLVDGIIKTPFRLVRNLFLNPALSK